MTLELAIVILFAAVCGLLVGTILGRRRGGGPVNRAKGTVHAMGSCDDASGSDGFPGGPKKASESQRPLSISDDPWAKPQNAKNRYGLDEVKIDLQFVEDAIENGLLHHDDDGIGKAQVEAAGYELFVSSHSAGMAPEARFGILVIRVPLKTDYTGSFTVNPDLENMSLSVEGQDAAFARVLFKSGWADLLLDFREIVETKGLVLSVADGEVSVKLIDCDHENVSMGPSVLQCLRLAAVLDRQNRQQKPDPRHD